MLEQEIAGNVYLKKVSNHETDHLFLRTHRGFIELLHGLCI